MKNGIIESASKNEPTVENVKKLAESMPQYVMDSIKDVGAESLIPEAAKILEQTANQVNSGNEIEFDNFDFIARYYQLHVNLVFQQGIEQLVESHESIV